MAPQASNTDIPNVVRTAADQFGQNHGDQAVKGLESFVDDFYKTHRDDPAALRDFNKQIMKEMERTNLLPRILSEEFGGDKFKRLDGAGANNPRNGAFDKSDADGIRATGRDGDNKPLSPLQQMAVHYMAQHMSDITGRPNGSVTPADIQGWANRERQQKERIDGSNAMLIHSENNGGRNTDKDVRRMFGQNIARAQDTLAQAGKLDAIENGKVQGIPSDIAAEYLRTHFSRTDGRGSAMGLMAQNGPNFDRISREDIENHFKQLTPSTWNNKLREECLAFFDADKTPKTSEYNRAKGYNVDYLSLENIETGRQNAARARAAIDYLERVNPVDNPNGLTNWQRLATYDGKRDGANQPTADGRKNDSNYSMHRDRATSLIDDTNTRLKEIPADQQDSATAQELREKRAALEFVNETVANYNTALVGSNWDRLSDLKAYANKLGYRPGMMGNGTGEQAQPVVNYQPPEATTTDKPAGPNSPLNPEAPTQALNWKQGKDALDKPAKTQADWTQAETELGKAWEAYSKKSPDNEFRNKVAVDYAEAILGNPANAGNKEKQDQALKLLTEASPYFKAHPENEAHRSDVIKKYLTPEAEPPKEKPAAPKEKTYAEILNEQTAAMNVRTAAHNVYNEGLPHATEALTTTDPAKAGAEWKAAEELFRKAHAVIPAGVNDKLGSEIAGDLAQAILGNPENANNPAKQEEARRLLHDALAYNNLHGDLDGLRKRSYEALQKDLEKKADAPAPAAAPGYTPDLMNKFVNDHFQALSTDGKHVTKQDLDQYGDTFGKKMSPQDQQVFEQLKARYDAIADKDGKGITKDSLNAYAQAAAEKRKSSEGLSTVNKALNDGDFEKIAKGKPLTKDNLQHSLELSKEMLDYVPAEAKPKLEQRIALAQYLSDNYDKLTTKNSDGVDQGIQLAKVKEALSKRIDPTPDFIDATGKPANPEKPNEYKWPTITTPTEQEQKPKPTPAEKTDEEKQQERQKKYEEEVKAYIKDNITDKGSYAGVENYTKALNDAARSGKPLKLVIGGPNNTSDMLGKAATDAGRGDCVVLYLDQKSVDASSPLGQYIERNFPKGGAMTTNIGWDNQNNYYFMNATMDYGSPAQTYNPQPTSYNYPQQNPYRPCQQQQWGRSYYYQPPARWSRWGR
jgi:hypothetical protein